jgi:hypothetical protein
VKKLGAFDMLCVAAGLATVIYATGDLLSFWELEPLVVLILGGILSCKFVLGKDPANG